MIDGSSSLTSSNSRLESASLVVSSDVPSRNHFLGVLLSPMAGPMLRRRRSLILSWRTMVGVLGQLLLRSQRLQKRRRNAFLIFLVEAVMVEGLGVVVVVSSWTQERCCK